MLDPQSAVEEFECCAREFGFVGAMIDAHLPDGRYYAGEVFWQVFEKAEELEVPIYIHPTNPTPQIQDLLFKGNCPDYVALALGISGIGWHFDTGLSVLKLYAAGVFSN